MKKSYPQTSTLIYDTTIDLSTDQPSIISNHSYKKIDYEKQIKQQMQLISSLRSQSRALKQQNNSLKIAKQGLQNQTNMLKDMLREKKEMVMGINLNLEKANQEINRLQDLLNDKNVHINHCKQTIEQLENTVNDYNKKFSQMSLVNDKKTTKIQNLEQKFRNDLIDMQKKYEKKHQQYKQFIVQTLSQAKSVNKNQLGRSSHYSNTCNKNNNAFNITSNLQQLLSSLTKDYNSSHEQIKNLSSALEQKQSIIQTLQVKIASFQKERQILQDRFNEATQLISDQKQLMKKEQQSKLKLKNQFNNLQNYVRQLKLKENQKIQQIINVLRPIIPEEIVELIEKTYDDDGIDENFYRQDIEKSILNILQKNRDSNILRSQNVQLKNRIAYLQEQADNWRLKYDILKRQYDNVTDDNRRLLKFNSLTMFRASRNNLLQQKAHKENQINLANRSAKSTLQNTQKLQKKNYQTQNSSIKIKKYN